MYPWHEMIWVWSVSTHKVIGVFCWYDPERFLFSIVFRAAAAARGYMAADAALGCMAAAALGYLAAAAALGCMAAVAALGFMAA